MSLFASILSSAVVWNPDLAARLAERLAGIPIHPQQPGPAPAVRPAYRTDAQGTALLTMRGPLLHRPPVAELQALGIEHIDAAALADAVSQADADARVRTIRIVASSAGGQATGIPALSAAIERTCKHVTVAVDGHLACGALWAVAHADRITATPASEIGGVGAYRLAVDQSRAYEGRGIRVHVISSGGVKGAGVPGTPVTTAALAVAQENVDLLASLFMAELIRAGRGQRADLLASGRTWLAADARRLGLIDAVVVNGQEV
jgi:ClpP class serine protease